MREIIIICMILLLIMIIVVGLMIVIEDLTEIKEINREICKKLKK